MTEKMLTGVASSAQDVLADVATNSPTAWIISVQPVRRNSRWLYRRVEAGNSIELMRAVEQLRRDDDCFSLYCIVAVDRDQRDFHESIFRFRTVRRNYVLAPNRIRLAYRMVFDLDSASEKCFPAVKDAAVRLRDLYQSVTGGGTLDVYTSGGNKGGLHLEGPAELVHPQASQVQAVFLTRLAREAKVPLLSDVRRAKASRPAVVVDDSIYGKVALGQMFQAPGRRLSRIDGKIVEEGVGKIYLPVDILRGIKTPGELRAELLRMHAAGHARLVPRWLTPGAPDEVMAEVRAVPVIVFEDAIREVETCSLAPPAWRHIRPARRPAKEKASGPPRNLPRSALDAIYAGCSIMRELRDLQERGRSLDRRLWLYFAAVLQALGEVGVEEVTRLDQSGMGDRFRQEAIDDFIAGIQGAGVKPTRCLSLASRAGKRGLGCGTPTNPCGFVDRGENIGASPFRHATFEPVRLRATAKPIDVVMKKITSAITDFFVEESSP